MTGLHWHLLPDVLDIVRVAQWRPLAHHEQPGSLEIKQHVPHLASYASQRADSEAETHKWHEAGTSLDVGSIISPSAATFAFL